MTPAYFAENPTPAPAKKPSALPRESAKKRAAREAAGQPIPRTTISNRSTPLARGGPPKRRKERIAAVNPEREKKRRQSYAKKLAAYKRSETYKLVEQRAGGRCEFSPPMWGFETGVIRCPNRRGEDGVKLHHHHLTYARFGGAELPEDIQLLCTGHHEAAESQHPTRKHFTGRRAGGESA